MRQIIIDAEGYIASEDKKALVCPAISDSTGPVACSNRCAWFRIEETNVYCGEKFIGVIKEKTDA